MGDRPFSGRGSMRGLAAAGGLALAVRVTYVLAYKRRAQPLGDAFYYHYQADLLARGRWFVNPFLAEYFHRFVPAADHPPLWTMVLAVAALVGVKSFFGQLIWACVIGSAAAVVIGMAVGEMAGRRAGRTAAFVAALYPGLWINDGLLLSETLVPLVLGLTVMAAYRLRRNPSVRSAVALGAAVALAALTRSELLALVFLVPIMAVGQAGTVWRQRAKLGLVGLAAACLLIAPWTGFNLSRFHETVIVSSELGTTMAVANCPTTYHGPLLGYWSLPCSLAIHPPAGLDGAGQDNYAMTQAVRFIEHHASRLPVVVLARLGRELGVYRPVQGIDMDWILLARPRLIGWLAQIGYYLAVVLAIPGALALRRRRVTLVPLLAVVVVTLLAAAVTFGQNRYRLGIDVVVVMLASVTVSGWLERWREGRDEPPRRGQAAPEGGHDSQPKPVVGSTGTEDTHEGQRARTHRPVRA